MTANEAAGLACKEWPPASLMVSLSNHEGGGDRGAKRPAPFDRLRMRGYSGRGADLFCAMPVVWREITRS